MFICDFISTMKICEMDLHTMYCDLEKRFPPPHFFFSLMLSCTILILYVLLGG